MINESVTTHELHCPVHPFKRICWTAVFAGALVAVGLGFLLNLFSAALGLSVITVNHEGTYALAIGGLIGILIGLIVSMVAAGYTAGYLGRNFCPKRNFGILYGFITWSLALLISAVITVHINQYTMTYANAMNRTAVVSTNQTADQPANQTANPSSMTSAPRNQNAAPIVVTPDSLALSAFIIFVLFFIGAISTCAGACWAMTCERDD